MTYNGMTTIRLLTLEHISLNVPCPDWVMWPDALRYKGSIFVRKDPWIDENDKVYHEVTVYDVKETYPDIDDDDNW